MSEGFLGTAAPRFADMVLLAEIIMGLALLLGAAFARRGRFRLHAWCQSLVVVMNLGIIIGIMLPSFRNQVLPTLPDKLVNLYYSLATVHAVIGTVAEITALFVVLSAGTKLVPQRIRIKNYKLWMRGTLAFWWLSLLLGTATYAIWYIPLLLPS